MAHPHAKTVLALLAALLLAGCGSDPERADPGRLDFTLTDFRIAPQEVRIKRGDTTITVTNEGRLAHNLKVKAGERTQIGFESMLPGATTGKVRTLRRGTYTLVCTIGNHEELGMYGTLVVR